MSEKTLVKKLTKVMVEVKNIEKRGYNKFHGYKYATESDVADSVRDILARESVMMIPNMTSHSIREHTNNKGKVEYIATVVVEYTFYDGDSGETISFTGIGEGQDAGDKAVYKAMTGAQKYALMKAFMIPTNDDPEQDNGVDERNNDNSNKQSKNNVSTFNNGASDKQKSMVRALLSDLKKAKSIADDVALKTLQQRISVNKPIDEFSKTEASKAIEYLQGQK